MLNRNNLANENKCLFNLKNTMDSNYIIDRLKATPYKYPTVALLQTRLNNLDEEIKGEILSSLKKQLHMTSNIDIQVPLEELVYHLPKAS